MKIKEGFMLRNIAGNNVVVAVGKATLDFSGMITLNGSGAFLWSLLQNDTTIDEMALKMCGTYDDVNIETATNDITEFVTKLKGAGIVE
ncbi:MAG: PqqD family protein [Clostridia bacterium]|nr:PqqD family protein [Clostridia bacterium]